MLEPVIKTVEVPCGQEKAFTVFLDEMETWWPVDKFTTSKMSGSSVKAIKVDSKVGGKIIEVSEEGTEYLWGEIKTYNPYDVFTMDFHIPGPGWDIGPMSQVEVRFTDMGDNRTRVVLTQTDWEALGDMAEDIRGGYNLGWNPILEAFKSKCGG